MSIDKLLFYLALVIMLLVLITKPKGKTKTTLIIVFLFFLFGPAFLPSIIFGKWNSIRELHNKTITKVIIKPYWTLSNINLSDTTLELHNPEQLAHIQHLLKNTTIYEAGHSPDIWQTALILITKESDSLPMHIFKTTNQGTKIFKDRSTDSYNQNELGNYLEKIVKYSKN
jgi:hypothetical protein